MKRLLALSIISLLLLTVTPVLASKNSSSPQSTCDPDASWKNHGAYVSCVAKLKLGGATVSEAARSEIGKKLVSPSTSPSSSPSASPSTTPFVSPTPVGIGDTNPNSSLVQGSKIESLKYLMTN